MDDVYVAIAIEVLVVFVTVALLLRALLYYLVHVRRSYD
jgi:hypothetical protein